MEQEYTQQEIEKLLATNRALAEKVCELEEENIGLKDCIDYLHRKTTELEDKLWEIHMCASPFSP